VKGGLPGKGMHNEVRGDFFHEWIGGGNDQRAFDFTQPRQPPGCRDQIRRRDSQRRHGRRVGFEKRAQRGYPVGQARGSVQTGFAKGKPAHDFPGRAPHIGLVGFKRLPEDVAQCLFARCTPVLLLKVPAGGIVTDQPDEFRQGQVVVRVDNGAHQQQPLLYRGSFKLACAAYDLAGNAFLQQGDFDLLSCVVAAVEDGHF
jgi:hypothetical protein